MLPRLTTAPSLIPETKGRSLEEMDVIFGSVDKDQRQADIAKHEKGELMSLQTIMMSEGSP